ncbi:unnamed protein product [Hymenolepis diminuta]|uniref:P/Homo B domain-containing protein n=1 Tax=Hymenolepis diminuta TaxID=6216 RepID=A0A158QEN5_HYMDI|nr:unnamed protein product [Hymenolepis diminuta]
MSELPWVRGIDHQTPFYLQKKTVINGADSDGPEAAFQVNDDEYRLVYEHHAKQLRKKLKFNDPNAPYMWQLLNDGNQFIGKNPGIDINVYPVYAVNITGKNIMAIVVDDALDTTHEDLIPNINFDFLADLLNNTRVDARGTDEKMPKSDDHGTEVAGLYAAVANNSRCAFGVAYDAKLGAVRLLGDKVTDYMVGEALTLFAENARIYITSWGPSDNGKSFRSPGKYMRKALKETWLNGNYGKGSVFIFPTGNGGLQGDNCGADGFVNHQNVIGVSALSENGLPPSYSEACAAVTVAVPPTTKINNMCTRGFVGTSASNPMAAGVIALAMEANPDLKPRDVSAILALSGRIPTASATDMYINGGGYLVSHTYGSGLLNAVRMVKLAKTWVPLGRRRTCVKQRGRWAVSPKDMKKSPFTQNLYPHKTVNFAFSFNSTDCDVEIIELVRVGMQWSCEHRGSLEVKLTSPSGQYAYLLYPRIKDHFKGKSEMIWKSLMHTGERCVGTWTVSVRDTGRRGYPTRRTSASHTSGAVRFIAIELLGTLENESAFQQNKENIAKHWHNERLNAHNKSKAVVLDEKKTAEIYDHERWHTLYETMEN